MAFFGPYMHMLLERRHPEKVKLPEVKSGPPRKRNQSPHDPSFIQRLYRHNRQKAVCLIRNSNSNQCSVPNNDLVHQFFSPPADNFDASVFDRPGDSPSPPNSANFSANEVWQKLRSCENTSLGPNCLTYLHLRGVDPSEQTLAVVFNICLASKRIPSSWKESRTIFLPKDGNLCSASSWRPIALTSTIYKIFAGLLAKKISEWVEDFEVLSSFQKGYRPFDGTLENNFVLQQHTDSAQHRNKELCLHLVNIKNAFASVSHAALIAALSAAGLGEHLCSLITDIYRDNC